VQTKLRMLVSQNVLNIYPAYVKWAWHFFGLHSFCLVHYLWYISSMGLDYDDGGDLALG